MAVQGQWNIGGINLPDYGWTEKLFGSGAQAQTPVGNVPLYNPLVPQSQGLSSSGFQSGFSGGTSGGAGGANISTTSAPASTGGGGSWTAPQQSGGQPPNAQTTYINGKKLADMIKDGQADQYGNMITGGTVDNSQVINDINNAYGEYFSALDAQLGTIADQRAQQEGIVNSQLTQGMNTLGSQKTQGLADLGGERTKNTENQVKTLQDLADNIRNQFQAGRLNLGARGAGDSSAANQYSYAIAKMGNKARGDVFGQTRSIENEIAGREFKLKNIYDTETKNLQEQTNQKILEVANWFSQAQQQIQQMKAQGQLAKGQDLASLSKQALSMAQNQLLMAQQEAAQKRSALDTWAMNNATTIEGLKSNLAQVSQYSAPGVARPEISGQIYQDAAGNVSGPAYKNPYGFSTTASAEDKTKQYPWLTNQTGVTWGA